MKLMQLLHLLLVLLTHVDQAETTWNYQFSVWLKNVLKCVQLARFHGFAWPLTAQSLLRSDHQSSFCPSRFSTVIFSSMTSLQKEEFFELVATAQARRLDDQRAQLERSPPPKPKTRSFRGSIKQLSFVKKPPAPVPVPKEDLYNMILTTQVSNLN